MRKHQKTYGTARKKRPRAEEEFSEEERLSQPDLTRSVKENVAYFSQDSKQPNPTPSDQDSQQNLKTESAAAVTPAGNPTNTTSTAAPTPFDLVVNYEEGLPQLLHEGLQSDDADIVVQAGEDIFKMLAPSTQNEKGTLAEFIGMGGHSIVLMTMKKWPRNILIQAKCCGCLAKITHEWLNDDILASTKLDLVHNLQLMGAMEYVVVALARFPANMEVQSSGISAIANLCYDIHNPARARGNAQRLCQELHGVGLVVNAMKGFPKVEKIQQHGCWFFKRMCTHGLGKEPVMKTEALVAIAAAVQTFPNQPEISEYAFACMTAIMRPPPKPSLSLQLAT